MRNLGPLDERQLIRERLDDMLGERSEGELALVASMVREFPARATQLITEATTAVARDDGPTAARAVHGLKGTALNLGLTWLATLCQTLQHQLEGQGAVAWTTAAAAELSGEVTRTIPVLADAAAAPATGSTPSEIPGTTGTTRQES